MSRSRTRRVVQLLMIAGGVVAAGPAVAGATGARLQVGSAPRVPHGARFVSALPDDRRMRLTIALTPRHAADLTALASAVSTPGSAQFRQYLSVRQFAGRFGATTAQIAAVTSSLRAAGLTVGAAAANHLTLPVTGSAAQIEHAFSLRESRVRLRGGRVAFTNDRAPMLAAGVAGDVQAVIGLDSLQTLHPAGLVTHARSPRARPAARAHVVTGGPQPCAGAISPSGYTADTVATAYQLSPLYQGGDLGQGQSVGVVEFEPYDTGDIATYQQCYGTTTQVTPVNVDGGPGNDISGSTDDGEAALDIEQVIGLAPRASVLVYQAPNTLEEGARVFAQIASDDQAKVISDSWGVCEPDEQTSDPATTTAEHTWLQEMAAQGQSLLVASGDSGSEACSANNNSPNWLRLSVNIPASDPFATGVGGSTLYTTDGGTAARYAPGNTPAEGLWNDNDGATGGGISTLYGMPSFQSSASASLGLVNSANTGSACGATSPCREVPDVSADADPETGYQFFVTSGAREWMTIGGTSAAAPLWAALFALTNADSACHGITVGDANPSLYSLAGSAYAANFRDVNSANPLSGLGDNDFTGSVPGDWPVAPGYDMGTGLGSPLGSALAASLCALRTPVYSVAVASPGSQTSVTGTAVSVALHGSDSGNAALTYSAAGLPAGLTLNPATGTISGTPTTAQTATVTVSAQDTFANSGSTSFTWTVVAPGKPQLSTAHTLSGLGKGKPKLTLSIGAGTFAPGLKSVAVTLPGGLRFAKVVKSLTKGISVKAQGRKVPFTVKLSRGVIIITFASPVTSASLTLGGPAVTITKAEATKIRKHKVKTLSVLVKATDAADQTTSFRVTFRKLT